MNHVTMKTFLFLQQQSNRYHHNNKVHGLIVYFTDYYRSLLLPMFVVIDRLAASFLIGGVVGGAGLYLPYCYQ